LSFLLERQIHIQLIKVMTKLTIKSSFICHPNTTLDPRFINYTIQRKAKVTRRSHKQFEIYLWLLFRSPLSLHCAALLWFLSMLQCIITSVFLYNHSVDYLFFMLQFLIKNYILRDILSIYTYTSCLVSLYPFFIEFSSAKKYKLKSYFFNNNMMHVIMP